MSESATNNPFTCWSWAWESSGITMALIALFATYIGGLQLLRFRRMHRMQAMDVKADPSAVYREFSMLEFPFTVDKALAFALFRSYGVPSISKLLRKTGQFNNCVGKRFDDTDFILREYSENDTETERGQKAMERLNAIHGMYAKQISNGDMLYTLSLFISEPPKWIDRYEWRKTTDAEKAALLGHYGKMGMRMGIKGVSDWKTWDDACAFQEAYEDQHFVYDSANNSIGESTLVLLLSTVPAPLRPAGKWVVFALMDPPLLKAMGFPQAPLLLQWIMKGVLLLKAFLVRFFLPPRPEFLVFRRTPFEADISPEATDGGDRDPLLKPRFSPYTDKKLGCLFYKNGYRIEEVGTHACPAGRLMHELPSYSGRGGGGSDAW